MPPRKKNDAKGLRLTLPGAPNTGHTIERPGIPGLFWPDSPTPLDGPGLPSAKAAAEADKDPGCPVELVPMTDADLDVYLERMAELRTPAQMRVLAAAIRSGGTEAEIATEQAEQITAGKDT